MNILKSTALLPVFLVAILIASCTTQNAMSSNEKAKVPATPEGHEVITLGAGCFWCIEAVLQRLEGIDSVTSGYTGGNTENPSYADICRGDTNHAEVVRVVYDPKKLSTEALLKWFWKLHDPTTLNRQGHDRGTQYRSAIFFHSEEQKKIAEASKKEANPTFNNKIVTEITKAPVFYPAEVSHQDYYRLNKRNPYCNAIIPPKLKKLGLFDKKEIVK